MDTTWELVFKLRPISDLIIKGDQDYKSIQLYDSYNPHNLITLRNLTAAAKLQCPKMKHLIVITLYISIINFNQVHIKILKSQQCMIDLIDFPLNEILFIMFMIRRTYYNSIVHVFSAKTEEQIISWLHGAINTFQGNILPQVLGT